MLRALRPLLPLPSSPWLCSGERWPPGQRLSKSIFREEQAGLGWGWGGRDADVTWTSGQRTRPPFSVSRKTAAS